MQQGIRRLVALAAVFAVAFGTVYFIRNGKQGLTALLSGKSDSSARGFRPEHYTFPERPPLGLGDVELLARLDAEYAKLTEAVVPSVVSIDTQGERSEFTLDGFHRQYRRKVPVQGQGSGVIVSHEGHVVTNYHVIANQVNIRVTLHKGDTYSAKVIGKDQLLDIAVLKIEGNGAKFQPLKFGDSTQVRRGQIVFAIGNPFGLGETITQGIISAVERSLSDTQRDLFQTDAAINPGNSGGPLVSLQGEIIGINSAIYTPDRANPGFQGVGFSIPANDVKETLLSILERGEPIRGYLGVTLSEGPTGIISGVVPESPAERAGLKAGDVIISFDGEQIKGTAQLINLIQRSKVDDRIAIGVWRAGRQLDLQATISENQISKMQEPMELQGKTRDEEEILRAIGLDVRNVTPQERLRGFYGVVASVVRPEGLAADRVQAGDLIYALNESRIHNSNEFYLYLSASAAVQATTLHVYRKGQQMRVNLPVLPRTEVSPTE